MLNPNHISLQWKTLSGVEGEKIIMLLTWTRQLAFNFVGSKYTVLLLPTKFVNCCLACAGLLGSASKAGLLNVEVSKVTFSPPAKILGPPGCRYQGYNTLILAPSAIYTISPSHHLHHHWLWQQLYNLNCDELLAPHEFIYKSMVVWCLILDTISFCLIWPHFKTNMCT